MHVFCVNLGGTAEGFAFRPNSWDGGYFFVPKLIKFLIFLIRSMTMKAQLEAIRSAALEAIAGTGARAELEAVRVQYLGKKGELTAVLKQMGKLSL